MERAQDQFLRRTSDDVRNHGEHPVRSKTDVSSLRYCIYAMAPMPGPLLRRLLDEFARRSSCLRVKLEMYPSTMMLRPEQQLLKEGNYWGEPSIVNDVAIMDDDGTLLPRGQIGEIVHRGPNVMLGYYRTHRQPPIPAIWLASHR